MSYKRIQDPAGLLRRLGGLHDAEITKFEWSRDVITLGLDDLFANFLGLPEYRGPRPAVITFSGLQGLSLALDSSVGERVTVYSCKVNEKPHPEMVEVRMQLAPGGRIDLECRTVEADFDPTVMR